MIMGENVEIRRSSAIDNPSDIERIRLKAQREWLSTDDICGILQNYEKFQNTAKAPNKPQRKRRSIKDGYNWRKRENHQKLKDESINCYYAYRKENENFQRRRYWMLKGDFSNIVLVHYLEVTGKPEDSSCVRETQGAGPYSQETKDTMPNFDVDGSRHSSSHPKNDRVTENKDTTSLNGALALEYEIGSSDYNHQPSSGFDSSLELQQPPAENIDAGDIPCMDLSPTQLDKGKSDNDAELTHAIWTNFESMSWTEVNDYLGNCTEPIQDQPLLCSSPSDIMGEFFSNSVVSDLGDLQIQKESKASVEDSSSLSKQPMDQKLHSDSACDTTSKFHKEVNHLELMNSIDPWLKCPDIRNDNSMENCFQTLLLNEEHNYALQPDSDGCLNLEGKSSAREHLFDGHLTEEGSKKRSSSGANGETGENENENEVSSIPSEGKLDIQDINAAENNSDRIEANLLLRFVKILWSGSSATNSVTSSLEDASQLSSKISSLLKGDNKELDQMLKTGSGTEISSEKFKDQLLQMLLKEKLRVWISQKVAEGGDAPSILDECGPGLLHLAAALGYDWALKPTIDAGVSVDFPDANGWTALHWAAFCGRENTVASLISLDASPGALTEPSPKYPLLRTPADLASANGHKSMAVYLGKRPLGVHNSSINLDNQDDVGRRPKAVQNVSEIRAAPLSLGNASDGQSGKDSLATICVPITEHTVLENQNLLGNQSRLKKIVLQFNFKCEKCKTKAIKRVARLPGVDSISFDMKTKRMQVIGEGIDSVAMVTKLRKRFYAEIISVEERNERIERDERIGRNKEEKEEKKEEDEGPEDEGPEGEGMEKDEGLEEDEGPKKEKEKEEEEKGKKRAPDPALESGKAHKILKAYLAYKALLTAYYNVQSMETIEMLGLVFVEALKKLEEESFLILVIDLICRRFAYGGVNTGGIKRKFLDILVLPPLICLSRSDVDVGVGRLSLGEFQG